MKKSILATSLILFCSAARTAGNYENEAIFYEEFSPLKSEQQIATFSNYYQSVVNENEPDTLSWRGRVDVLAGNTS